MKTKYQDKHKKLAEEVQQKLIALVKKKGVESEFKSCKVLVVKEDHNFNLDGDRYLAEISETGLIDSNGYEYGFSSLYLDQLCEILDSF